MPARGQIKSVRCPNCRSAWVRERRQWFKCNHCEATFTKADGMRAASAKPPAKVNSGSGVVAGKITIGRGMKWGAGY